jgi:hypothetical protein
MRGHSFLAMAAISSILLTSGKAQANSADVHYVLQRGKQSVYAMPDAPRMERFWLNATLDKSRGLLVAVWGYEEGGGQDGAQVSMTKQGETWAGQGKNWAGNLVKFEISKDSFTYQWGPRLEGGGPDAMLGQIVWGIR